MKFKKTFLLCLCLIMIFTIALPLEAFATDIKDKHNPQSFKDVPKGHWAYEAINWMLLNKIVEGTGNGYFTPNKEVARDEFAKMMVLTLKLKLVNPEQPSFKDVKKGGWQYKYVETAKPYLTVYRTESGDLYYHPSEPSMREDMAVALVKALGYSQDPVDEGILDMFADEDEISPRLRKYVAIAVKRKIMQGYDKNGRRYFGPQETLTRAQAAVLLHNAFKENEEKITLEEEKEAFDDITDAIPVDEETGYEIPVVTAVYSDNKIVLKWDRITDKDFTGYKVVASRYNEHPSYPDDGYFKYITDRNITQVEIKAGDCYSGGDIGGSFKGGVEYYFSITAIYGKTRVAGNAVKLEMPFKDGHNEDWEEYSAPIVKAETAKGKIILKWSKAPDKDFSYYKIVISKHDSTPAYPDDGYLVCITDRNTTSWQIKPGDSYNGGDFGGKLKAGEKYYFSVTAVYGNVKKAGNAVMLVMPK